MKIDVGDMVLIKSYQKNKGSLNIEKVDEWFKGKNNRTTSSVFTSTQTAL